MLHLFVILLNVTLLTGGPVHLVAEPVEALSDLQIDSTLDPISNAGLVDAIIAAAPVEPDTDLGDPAIEPSSAGIAGSDWTDGNEPGVAYPVTDTISVGVGYQLEEIEDLTVDRIEMGTAGVDYTSHKVLVRAHWQFDLIP